MLSENQSSLVIGRHCLMRKPDYLLGAVREAVSYGANALMIYLGAPQNSFRSPLSELKVTEFKEICQTQNIDISNVVVHAPYLINLANVENEKIFRWSVEFLKKEVERMTKIGLKTLILHPGSALQSESTVALSQLVKGLNMILKETDGVRIALETMCKRGGELGSEFEQLKYVIEQVNHQEKIGICWDTCHLYASGYDIKNNLERVIEEFDQKIGLDKLWVIHLNDSIFDLGENKDRHENIGYGKIGFEALHRIVWHPKLRDKIKLLETPRKRESYREEIKLLQRKN